MAYVNMREMLLSATGGGYAVGAFNIISELSARAAVDTCERIKAPVILQTSVSTVKQIGVEPLMGFLRGIAERANVPVAVHLDHCTDDALAMRCIDAGWSSVMIDASKEPLAKNIERTRAIAEYAAPRGVSVEGELGAIVGVEDHIVVSAQDAHLARVEDSEQFVRETGVDAFAPAVGTAHGQYKGEPKLDFERFERIRAVCAAPLVVHGGTGLSDEVFQRFVSLGAAKINISTAIKMAYLDGIRAFMSGNPDCANPLKLDLYLYQRFSQVVEDCSRTFGAANRA